jgi:hypothetical protein
VRNLEASNFIIAGLFVPSILSVIFSIASNFFSKLQKDKGSF